MCREGYPGYVHSCRGFAILSVVAVHALALAMLIPRDLFALAMSVLVVRVLRLLLGRNSRLLIGS